MVQQDKNTRIIKNTGLLYFRTAVSMIVSLFTSRLVLQGLGIEDYGIYNAVGGFVSMFWIVTSALASAFSRFLNFELGRNDTKALYEVFSIALNIMLILGAIVLVLGEIFGMWFLSSKMSVPPEKMHAAQLVFHISVFTTITGFVTNPFNSAVISHEKMGIYAFSNIVEVFLKLFLALFLLYGKSTSDKLVLYAIGLALITALSRAYVVLYCVRHFSECRFRPILFTAKLKEMFGFAVWNFIGSVADTFSDQGVNMALNVSHGPKLNAARGLANTVHRSVSMLIYNFTMSLNPQITQSYATGDIARTNRLVISGTKFAAYLVLLIIIPFILEARFILNLWLTEVPEHTVIFTQLSLVYCFVYILDYLFSVAKMAIGNIRIYKLIQSILSFLNFPLAVIILTNDYSPALIYVTPIIIQLTKIIVTLTFVHRPLSLSWVEILRFVYLPISIVLILSVLVPLLIHTNMDYGWLRFILILVASTLCTSFTALGLGCDKKERELLLTQGKRMIVVFKSRH